MAGKFSNMSFLFIGFAILVILFFVFGIVGKVSENFDTPTDCANYDNNIKCTYNKCKWNRLGCYDKDNKYMGKDRVSKLSCNPDYGNKWYDDEFCS